MGQDIQLTASDGHTFAAYRADPSGAGHSVPRGAIVVIQEIFGVNAHMREVADSYANAGYVAITPALFDRKQRNLELGYDENDIATGRDIAFPLGFDGPAMDLAAAVAVAKEFGKVGSVGYCWGGSLSFLCSCQLGVDCAVGYYGGQITKLMDSGADAIPKAPPLLHFGTQDAGIPLADVERIRSSHPDVTIHMYEAGHGFNCDHRGSFDQGSCDSARERSLAFFAQHLGQDLH